MTGSTLPTVDGLLALHGELPVLPLSAAQQRFWLLDQIEGEAGGYTLHTALRLAGPLDADALARAFTALCERHEVLRSRFVLDGEAPVQVVLPAPTATLAVEDLSALAPAEREAAIAEAVRRNANAPFDLAGAAPVRARLLREGPAQHVFLLAVHHIAGDGWSLGVLYEDLAALHGALAAGQAPALPPLPLQYADFAVWQQRALAGAAAERQLAYWRERLRALPVLDLPTDRPRPVQPGPAGGKRELALDAATYAGLRALAQRTGTTPATATMAAFVALLVRYTGQDDVVVGTIVSGRARAELERVVGPFVNALAIRADATGDPSLATLVARLRDATAEAYANQDVPFERVIDAVAPERDRSRTPVFQVAFQWLEGLGRPLALAGVAVEPLRGTKGTTMFDLTLQCAPLPDGGLRAVLEFRHDLFDAATVDRMLAHLAQIAAAAAAAPDARVTTLELVAPAERDALVAASVGPARAVTELPVHALVDAQVARAPGAIAVDDGTTQLTYAELDAAAHRLAAVLRDAGVRPGDPVGLCLPRDARLPVALLATLRTGAHYVPLDPSYPGARLAHVIADAAIRVAVAVEATTAALGGAVPVVIRLDADAARVAAAPATPGPAVAGGDALAYVLHTSGSTGTPKGVQIPHRALANLLASFAARTPLAPTDALVAVTTLSFDIAGLELWLPLVSGARVVVVPREVTLDGAALAARLAATAAAVAPVGGRVTMQATPATWRLLLDAGWPGTPGLRMLVGGEAWPEGLAAALLPRGAELWNVYGPTETTIWSSCAHVTAPGAPSLGAPLDNTSLVVLGPGGQLLPLGVPGELFIGGAGVAHGYLNRAELSAERFVPDRLGLTPPWGTLYRTGDRVRRRGDGALEFLGRLDGQVKVRGFRIELGEVEAALAAQPGVAQAVAVVRGEAGDGRLVGYLVPTDGAAPPAPAALAEALRRKLPEFMVPSAFVVLAALPLTPNGKVDRRALPAPDRAALGVAAPVAPRTALEAQVAAAWAAVLGLATVGVEDDFFALGGHSLLAMRVVAKLAGQVPGRVTIGMLFEARTVAALAARLSAAPAAAEDDLEALLADVEGLSDEDAARQLAEGEA